MTWLGSLGLWWQSRKTRRKMDRVFSRREDPFRYAESGYEIRRFQTMEAALGERRYGRALEIGCAEGHFSQRLVRRCETLIAVDISEIALTRASKAVPQAEFIRADVRSWEPEGTFDLIVLGDVLYYLDKPLVRDQFKRTFQRITSWMSPFSRLLLAHAFATEGEREHRQSFTRRFAALGLALTSESVVSPDDPANPVRCLIAVLDKK